MSNLTTDRATVKKAGIQQNLGPYGLPASAVAPAGVLQAIDSNGRLKNPGAVADLVLGWTEKRYDNSVGANDAVKAELCTGVARWDGHATNPPTNADIGKRAYASDNHTISRLPTDGSLAGIVIFVDATGVWVWTDPTALSRNLGLQAGQATLVAGAVTVTNALVTAGSIILLTRAVAGGTLGDLKVGAIVAGTSFGIASANAADTSTVNWLIVS